MISRKFAAMRAALGAFSPSTAGALACRLDRSLERLAEARTLDEARGCEGALAATWLRTLAASLPEPWRFSKRSRRPPRDPANAVLSLGYTLACEQMLQATIAAGLDPSVGFLHETAPACPALALDLLEPLRIGVDLFLLEAASTELDPQTSFTRSRQEGCRLTKSSRAAFYSAWAEWSANWPGVRPDVDTDGGEPRSVTLAQTAAALATSFRRQLGALAGQDSQ